MVSREIKIHEFELFKKHIHLDHAVFTRQGGVSSKPFDSLNIGKNSGDISSNIEQNRKLVHQKNNAKHLVFLNQAHTSKIKVLKKKDIGRIENFQKEVQGWTADGIITDIKDVCLVIQVADCQAVLLYDHVKKVIANVHSGWKGSIANIIGNCVDKMISEFGCRPENIIAGISPSLGPCCSEFINYKEEIPENLWDYKIHGEKYFDFWKMSADQLMEKGVKKECIENMRICTKCNSDIFFSYRQENITGRFACVISLVK